MNKNIKRRSQKWYRGADFILFIIAGREVFNHPFSLIRKNLLVFEFFYLLLPISHFPFDAIHAAQNRRIVYRPNHRSP
jgi:hypothetical protein